LVVMGIHSNFLAVPVKAGDPNLRNADAQAIEKFLGNWLGKPEASINRKLFSPGASNIRIGKPDTWNSFVDRELALPPEIELNISNSFDATTRMLKTTLTATAKKIITEAVHLHVAITESKIVADQKDNRIPSGVIENYVLQHALRKLLTDVKGDRIADSMSEGEKIVKEYTFVLPTDAVLWVAENCSVVAFVSQDEIKKYVYQAAEAKVK